MISVTGVFVAQSRWSCSLPHLSQPVGSTGHSRLLLLLELCSLPPPLRSPWLVLLCFPLLVKSALGPLSVYTHSLVDLT